MDEPNLAASHETPRDLVEIRDEDAITIDAALAMAADAPFPLGKSTLQRWAKFWREHPGGQVRSVLVDTSAGRFYRLSRDDFQAWLFEQKQNERPHEAPQDPERPHKVSQDLPRSHETPQDPATSHETSAAADTANRVKELEAENMHLKIDLGVRKQLLERVKDEIDELRSMSNNILRENGALEFQLRQLTAGTPRREVIDAPSPAPERQHSEPVNSDGQADARIG